MRIRRVFLAVCLMLVSLVGDAQITVPDSLLTIQKAYRYHIVAPDTTQAILAAMRERKMAPDWRLDFAEGDLYFNLRRYRRALTYYQKIDGRPEMADSTHLQLLLLKRMMDCDDDLYKEGDLVRTIMRLRKLAMRHGDKAYEAMTYAMSGKWHHANGQTAHGYSDCQKALELMEASDFPNKHIELRDVYGELVKMYARDGRYDEALKVSQKQESEARQPGPVVILKADERGLRQTYAIRASILAQAGRMAEADKAYAAWKKTTGGNDIDDMAIFDYLWLSHHYDEALGVVMRNREFLHARGDTTSVRMLSVLNKEALLHLVLGQYAKAAEHGREIGVIADSIHKRRSSEQMQTTYKLLKEESSSQQKSQWLNILIVILVAILVLALVILYYVRYIRRRNVELMKVLNSLDAYRRAVLNGDALTSPKVVAAVETLRTVELPDAGSSHGVDAPDDEDRRLYIEMDTQVTRDRLFLKPGLGREDLMRLIGVDKNRFGKMMGKYSDASNTSVYISRKRVEYGAKLLLEQPDYTIATVATECGMSNTVTFNRIFKETYNMTPSEYRQKMGAVLRASQQH